EARRPPHVAMLVTPGMGHLIPLAELAKRLAARHGVTATLITFASTASATQRAFLASLPPAIASLSLPPVDLSDLGPGATIETLMSEECARLVPALTGVLSALRETTRLVARYLFHPGNLHGLMIMLHLPELDVSMPGEFRDLAEPVRLPGCVPIPGPDVMSGLQDKSDPCYRWMVHHARLYRESEAILVNSFDAVEPDAARVLTHPEPGRPPVYNIGPLIRADANDEPRAACLDWLDRQPPKSVIFVSFGSGGSLPTEHMRELALGLELTGQRFLWAVRSPSDEGTVNANYYDAESKKDPMA
uniref:UDP-glycosyltransferases domain-containing protein n=1 Tax=Aegilops tauschii subsp. strangulata TaxID=200361 RepID=A0A453DSL4_AEGTS